MAFSLSPVVNIKETDLSGLIPAVATSISVIVLRNCYKGPEMEPVFVSTPNELHNIFGYPVDRVYDESDSVSTKYKLISNAYEDMLSAEINLADNNMLYCTRVMPASATFAGTYMTDAGIFEQFSPIHTLETEYNPGLISDVNDPVELYSDLNMISKKFAIMASSRGSHGNKIRIGIIDKTTYNSILDGNPGNLAGEVIDVIENQNIDSPLFDNTDFLLIVQSKSQNNTHWENVELHNVSLDEHSTDDQGRSNFVETVINEESSYIKMVVDNDLIGENVPANWVTNDFTQLGGGTDYINNGDVNDSMIKEAYSLYSNPEEIDVNIFIDSNKSLTVKRHINEICQSRLDCTAVLDCELGHVRNNKGNEVTDLRDWIRTTLNMNSSFSAIYANWAEVYDQWNKKYRWIPMSGFVSGIYARNDILEDPWFAPAGLNRAILYSIRRLAWNPTLGQRNLLYQNRLNPVVSFSGQGKVIWGQKNLLDKASAFNRVNVRRLFITIEKAIATASKYFLFEFNDRFTRDRLKAMIDPYLRDVQTRRGIYDFKVVIDETNNTPERIDRNELWADIYIQPAKAAEFINLNFIATRTGVDFDELAGSINN